MRFHYALTIAAFFGLSQLSLAEVSYTLKLEPAAKTFDVTVACDATTPTTTFRIPAWTPGYYNIQQYQSKISGLKISDGKGADMPIVHTEDRAWTVTAPVGAHLTCSYRVLGDDEGLGFFGSMLDKRVGFINGASAFMYLPGRETEPVDLKVSLPDSWDIATELTKTGDLSYKSSTGYDEFIDNPIQMGSFVRKPFMVEGIPFEAVFVSPNGPISCKPDFEVQRLQQVSAPAIKMFGGSSFKHYTYIIHLAVGNFSGGLEHRASTCIALPNSIKLDMDDLAAHENFHAWNVKQIRPIELGPFDYSKQVRSANLWWMEGVTDYYSKILTYRSGLQDGQWLLNEIRDQIEELQQGHTRFTTTLADASKNCWENGGFGVGDMSYYTKGFVVGFILDASLRSVTHNQRSLDDVMRLLYSRYKLPQPGLPEDGLLKAIDEVAGKPLYEALYHKMVYTTDELPYDILRTLGLQALIPGRQYLIPGFDFENSVVTNVGPVAATAGLKVGDKIVELTDLPWNGTGEVSRQSYTLEIYRNGANQTLTIPYSTMPSNEFDLILDATAGPEAVRLRNNWLKRPDSRITGGNKSTVTDHNNPSK